MLQRDVSPQIKSVSTRLVDSRMTGWSGSDSTIRKFSHSHRVRTACSTSLPYNGCWRSALSKILFTAATHTTPKRHFSSPKPETNSEARQPPSAWLAIIISLNIKLLDGGYSIAIYFKCKAIPVHPWTDPDRSRMLILPVCKTIGTRRR